MISSPKDVSATDPRTGFTYVVRYMAHADKWELSEMPSGNLTLPLEVRMEPISYLGKEEAMRIAELWAKSGPERKREALLYEKRLRDSEMGRRRGGRF